MIKQSEYTLEKRIFVALLLILLVGCAGLFATSHHNGVRSDDPVPAPIAKTPATYESTPGPSVAAQQAPAQSDVEQPADSSATPAAAAQTVHPSKPVHIESTATAVNPVSLPVIAINTPPLITASVTDTVATMVQQPGGPRLYHALTLASSATDAEDGPITDPSRFSWHTVNGDCGVTDAPLCANEADGNSISVSVPVVQSCSGLRTETLTYAYTFRATVIDSSGATASTDVTINLSYDCLPDPAAIPTVSIITPTSQQYMNSPGGYARIPFKATATDREDGQFTAVSSYTWESKTTSCAQVNASPGIPCQTHYVGNDFTMNLIGGCPLTAPYANPYTYEVRVTDSDGNIGTNQVSFTVRALCGDISN